MITDIVVRNRIQHLVVQRPAAFFGKHLLHFFLCLARCRLLLRFLAHERCIEQGCRLLGSEPMSPLREDWSTWAGSSSDCSFTICIPVMPGSDAESDPSLRRFPATDALSIIGFGHYSVIPELWRLLLEEADARGLEPCGPQRTVALVALYVGDHIRPDEYRHECIIPVRK